MKLTLKQLQMISWILMGLSVTGNIFVNGKCVIGMIIWAVASSGWVFYSKIKKEYALMILNIIYTILNIIGIIMWS